MTNELVVAGYLVVRPEKLRGGGLPETDALVSVSACLIDQLPEDDCWFGTREEALRAVSGSEARPVALLIPPERAAALVAEIRASGVYEPVLMPTLEARGPLPDGGTVLGWEVLGYDLGHLHTWLCRDLHRDAVAELGVRTGPDGLLTNRAEAERVAAWAVDRGDTEPVAWFAGAIVAWPTRG